MITFNRTDPNLFKNNELYKLSLLIGRDNFLFALKSLSDNKIKSILSFYITGTPDTQAGEIHKIIDYYGLNSKSILRKNICFLSPEFSFVPLGFERSNDLNSILDHLTIKHYLDDYQVLNCDVRELQSKVFFPVKRSLFSVLTEQFEEFQIFHGIQIIAENILSYSTESDFVFCNFDYDNFQILAFKNRKFYSGSIIYNLEKDEILYNILSVYYKNAFLINKIKLILSGRIEEESPIFEILNHHIKFVSFVDFNKTPHFSEVFRDTKDHSFFDIFLLSKCV
jgi:hypothetical protein